MNKELVEIMDKIESKKMEAQVFLKEKKVKEAKALSLEINDLKEELELAKTLYEETKMEIPKEIKNEKEEKVNLATVFAKAIIGKELSANEMTEMKNLMSEGTKEKGGITVPVDVQTKIIELQRNKFDIRKYINVEPVGTLSGSRAIEANKPQASGFASLDEGLDIQALYEPEFAELTYKVRKYAGFIPLTNELLDDSDENILAYITRWMAKNEINTYNYQVFNGSGTNAAQGIMNSTALSGAKENVDFIAAGAKPIKKFKTVFNVDLEELASDNVVIFTNGDGYNFVDGLEDANGKSYLQPDATKASGNVFLGKEIVKVPKEFLANVLGGDTVTRTPFVIGDLELLYTMFDRKQMSVESSKIGGNAWRQDKTEAKGVFRFDGRLVDTEAVKILMAKLA